jgi:hypothetical protein
MNRAPPYQDAFGAARARGGADGKRLTGYTTASHRDQKRPHGRCFSGTKLGFGRQICSRPKNRGGRLDRNRLTQAQA